MDAPRDTNQVSSRRNSSDPTEHNAPLIRHGIDGLLREIASVCGALQDDTTAEWIYKRVQFLGYELSSLVGSQIGQQSPLTTRLTILNRFFFQTKSFQSVADEAYASDATPIYFLQSILVTRVGAASLIAMLYAYLAAQIGIAMEFVDLRPNCFLKYLDKGVSRFIDLTKAGRTLSSDEVINTIEKRFKAQNLPSAHLCETMPVEKVMVEFLRALKLSYTRRGDTQKLLEIQNRILHYQPNNLLLIGERAILHRKLGKFKSAFNDLKRYFAFQDREKSPSDLVKLYDDLRELFQTQKAQIEILE